MKPGNTRDQKLISYWLFIGMAMVFIQILLGGITRLTGSGLSITHWDIVMGSIPPLNSKQWEEAFDLYKITPQYQHINAGMEISEFKFIFFWEYLHRLWARSMSIVFLIPFLFFLSRGSLTRQVIRNLSWVIFFAALAAVFGWIMVASGLIDRPWVNAYKLTIHLTLGILLFLSLFYTWINQKGFEKHNTDPGMRKMILWTLAVTGLQVIFGGFVSGMKSSLSYPTWPMMNKQWIPSLLLDRTHWNIDNFLLYDKSGFMPALVLFVHRNIAYFLLVLFVFLAVKWYKENGIKWRWVSFFLLCSIVVQISLGILTLVNSIGHIPALLGSLHQGVGIITITFLFYLRLVIKPENITKQYNL